MAYGRDLAGAARRHKVAADLLHADDAPGSKPGNRAVAGYLFGLSGELALKQIMMKSGMRELDPTSRRDDPFYAHFPVLKTLLLNTAHGRRQGDILKFARNQSLFQKWETSMRYAPTTDVTEAMAAQWEAQAKDLIDQMDL